ncbi:hypothetical protein Pan4_50 [Pseudanabaena phage Pan4]|nr:hypothetical protein Pan4_50 [Pseudanabaena phage Pan4]
MSRFVLNAQERSVASICSMLCVEWFHPDERKNLLALLADGLPKCRPHPPLAELVAQAQKLLDATTVVEWSFARLAVSRALPDVLRPDVVVR